ncbi:MobF family relaxase [Novosphingobium sp. AP12]|uniref:MobF family relaxase n=1 Tax=Novosphingobium sp. AP12 TaxID=1144305 RepID=UPI000271FBB0|nr:MobF family relaxase [Novosphingobium sp. AP12]EJL22826.1 conjugative relaxase domain protein, TrwC/TraI family [Novosphingobium sp. AP12]
MHSIASVRSAGGAASYFAKDDYYTAEHSSEATGWGGKGAEELGLSGDVSKDDFENILNGKLPDGTLVNQTANRRTGIDLTFSMPKSASVMAYVASDKRILEAHMTAVKSTMSWVERTMAEARDYSRSKNGEPVRTGNLVYALFEHDTSRKLDPQGHIHVVIAAITKTAAGKWQGLWNGQLWKNNTAIGSAYHAAFRQELSKLGYETQLTGKHGAFEIKGVPKEVIQEFSKRREEIVAKAKEIGVTTPQGQDRVVVTTRDAKLEVEDRAKLGETWIARSVALGFDGKELLAEALGRSVGSMANDRDQPIGFASKVADILASVQSVIGDYLRPSDDLATKGLARIALTPAQLRTELAVGSAVRILGQREAAFSLTDVYKTALNLGLAGVTIEGVEKRVSALMEGGQLIKGATDRLDGVFTHVTTPEHVAQERQLLSGIDKGREASMPIVPGAQVAERLKQAGGEHQLNGEQLAAATLAMSTSDRIAVIQGVAGAGKTTLVQSIKALASQEGRETLGLAFANKMVGMLRDEAKIETQTVSSFVNAHLRGALAGSGPAFDASSAALAGKVIVLDESSLVANDAMNNLVTIANNLKVDRLIMIGDFKQLQSIDAGKAFQLVQSHQPAMAKLDISQRQKTQHMQQVAALSRAGNFREAFDVLGERVQSHGNDYLEKAAEKWLSLAPEERDGTAIYASGRVSRTTLNRLVQEGLKAEGTIKGEGLSLKTLQQVNATREEMRYVQTYKAGQVLDVVRNSPTVSLARGRYEVLGSDTKGRVVVRNERGTEIRFDPQRVHPDDKKEALKLSEKMDTTLHEGDKIRWTANDKQRGLDNSDYARVLSISENGVKIENARGEIHELQHGDKMLERLGLSYAINMHQAQGMTTDKGIGAMHSAEQNLATQRLTYVMLTRVRNDIEIFTNDRDQVLQTITHNPGDKPSALETIGEKQIDTGRSLDPAKAGTFSPTIPADVLVGGAAKAAFPTTGIDAPTPAKEPAMPPPAKEVDLPERNIERSR